MSGYEEAPFSVKIFALFTGLVGILGIMAGAGSYTIAQYVQLVGFPAFVNVMGIFVIILGLVYLLLAYGVWTLKSWALYIYFFVMFLGISVNFSMGNIWGAIADGFILGFLWFERGSFGGYVV